MSTVAPHRTASELTGEFRVLTEASTPDRVLVALTAGGDEHAFELLFARHRRPVYAYAQRMLCDHARAEDVVQEVFVSAFRAMYSGERPTHVRAWLHEIARRACIDQWRSVTRRGEVSYDAPDGLSLQDADCLAGGEDSVMRAAADREALETLRHAFADLPELQHTVLVQRELEGRSSREIAERLGISRTVVEGQLSRGRRTLAQAYRELQSGERCRAVRELSEASVREGIGVRDRQRLGSHLRTCAACRQHARALGVHSRFFDRPAVARAAALFPFPLALLRRWWPFDTTLPGEAAGGAVSGKVLVGAAVLAAGSGGAFVAGTPAPSPFAAHQRPAATSQAPTTVTPTTTFATASLGSGRITVLPPATRRHRASGGLHLASAVPRRARRRPALVVTAVPVKPTRRHAQTSLSGADSGTGTPPPSTSTASPPPPPTRVGPAAPARVGSDGSTAVPTAPSGSGPSEVGDAVVLTGTGSSDASSDPPASKSGEASSPDAPPADGDGAPLADGDGAGSPPADDDPSSPTTTDPTTPADPSSSGGTPTTAAGPSATPHTLLAPSDDAPEADDADATP